jgi:hypothetical protein
VWDPAAPRVGPVELGHHDGPVVAVAVLPDGRVVTSGSDRRVVVWGPGQPGTVAAQISCSARALATGPVGPAVSCLVVVHGGTGFSIWSVAT